MSRYIDAEEFDNLLCEFYKKYDEHKADAQKSAVAGVIGSLRNFPAADVVAVKHGEWIPKMIPTGVSAFGVDEMTCEEIVCSECGKKCWVGEENNYCPHCGAKMDGSEEE